MEVGPPEKGGRRPLQHPPPPPPPPPQWHNNGLTPNNPPLPHPPPTLSSRNLPPLTHPTSHQYGQSPFSRSDVPLPPIDTVDRRLSGHSERPPHDSQDNRRPLSGPPHGYQPPPSGPPHSQPSPYSGQREPPQRSPMIKRDPSAPVAEETPYRRSPSNHSEHNVNHHPPQEASRGGPYQHPHPHPHPHQPNPYEPPHQHRTNSYPPPQSPMGAPNQYPEPYPRAANFQHHEPYQSINYPQQQGTPRNDQKPRKAQRAAQACDNCRNLKAKCDEGRPKCNSCVEKGADCNYRDPPPKQQDKSNVDIAEMVLGMHNRMDNLFANVPWEVLGQLPHTSSAQSRQIEEVNRRLKRIEDLMVEKQTAVGRNSKQENPKPEILDPPLREVPPHPEPFQQVQRPSSISELLPMPVESEPSPTLDEAPMPDDASEEDEGGGAPRLHRPPTIPVNHTTSAAQLLTAPGIAPLVEGIIGRNHVIKNMMYPMIQELRRGPLNVFGRGEGSEAIPGYENDSVPDHFSASTPGDTHSEASTPSRDPEWQGTTTYPPDPLQSHAFQELVPEEYPEKEPNFSRDHVYKLVESYQSNINTMHPILNPEQLNIMVENFLKAVPGNQTRLKATNTSNPHAQFIGAWNPESPGNKRKRLPGGDYHEASHFWDSPKTVYPFRSISSAIVLLVMALGSICLHKTKLPDVTQCFSSENENVNSPVARNGYPSSPIQNSPVSRRPSVEGNHRKVDRTKLRNADLIPGLDYFGLATAIIGNQLSGNRLPHVHANILAGLYHGQLGRVLESHAYIHQACSSLQIILSDRRMERFKKVKENRGLVGRRDNPYCFAFWTCLQLESDIIAELPVPQSGILTLEEDMPTPNLKVAGEVHKFDPVILESYMAQLFLRKHLNTLHGLLYKPKDGENGEEPEPKAKKKNAPTDSKTIDMLESFIKVSSVWAGTLVWDGETGDRSNLFLHARLRAKYHGARVITYRPFLLEILEFSAKLSSANDPTQAVDPTQAAVSPPVYVSRAPAPTISSDATSPADIPQTTMEFAKKGLLALRYSTEAFWDVIDTRNKRLLVTNIWGTAHAQWGNLVTLQAAYNDPILKEHVLAIMTYHELKDLLEKTIAFISVNSTRTSALHSDVRILKHIGTKLGLLSGSAKPTPRSGIESVNSSFHSTAGGEEREVVMSGVYQS